MNKKKFLAILNRVLQISILVLLLQFVLGLKWHLVWENIDRFPHAIMLTILLTISGLLLGFVIAVPLALVRARRKPKWLAWFADFYVMVFRGSPLLVQLFLFYYGLAQFEWVRESILWIVLKSPLYTAILVLGLNSGAYACEIIRGALKNVPRGQLEAADALGLSLRQRNWLLWMPSALRLSIPQYGNEMIFLMHGTALAGLVTIMEVFGTARYVNKSHYTIYEGMIAAALIYILLTIILSFIAKFLENRYLRYLKL